MKEDLGFNKTSGLQFAQVKRSLSVIPLLFSVFAHFIVAGVLALLVLLQRSGPVIVRPTKAEQALAARADALVLPPAADRASLQISQKKGKHARTVRAQGKGTTTGVAALRAEAKRQTAALVNNFKFRTIYGFSPFPRYELPVQTSGQYPAVSADELPPRFEQYLVVEVTIDSQGRVADARITAGEVENRIASKVLAAVRQFKYRPATREGVPIPSQCDLVIHIPT